MGGILVVPGHNELVTGVMDVHGYLDNGLMWLRNDTGEIAMDGAGDPKRLLVSENDQNKYYGKAWRILFWWYVQSEYVRRE